jgi:hypothetical protein
LPLPQQPGSHSHGSPMAKIGLQTGGFVEIVQ